MRLAVCLALIPALSLAQVDVCAETFIECSEDCSLEHSSIRAEAAKKLEKCLKKCRKKRSVCEERELETKAGHLDPDALDKPKRDLDEMGMPKARRSEPSPGDDLRDDRPRAAEPEEAPLPKRARKEPAPEPERRPVKEAVREADLPKSTRTELKVVEEKREAPVAEPAKRSEPEPIVMTPKAESRRDDDLRDDRPREPPPATSTKKKRPDDLPPPPPKPKEEDHDDLRNF